MRQRAADLEAAEAAAARFDHEVDHAMLLRSRRTSIAGGARVTKKSGSDVEPAARGSSWGWSERVPSLSRRPTCE
jgi:hypothetical protein